MQEIIYILINEGMSGLCKIGYTNKPIEQRLRDLSRQTGVPLPFECFYAKKVKLSAREIEQWLHELFEEERINPRKEFFTTSPKRAALALKFVEGEEIMLKKNVIAENKQEVEALQKITQRRDNFNFEKTKIPVGSVLTFIYDDTVTCTLLVGNKVKFIGQKLSISEAARKAYKKEYRIAGTLYWMYEGETLDERRRRIDNEDGGNRK